MRRDQQNYATNTGHAERVSALVVTSPVGRATSTRSSAEHAAALDRLLADLAKPAATVGVRPISPTPSLRLRMA